MVHVSKVQFFHYTQKGNVSDIVVENYEDYVKFIQDSYATQLYQIAPYTIGLNQVKDINIDAFPNQLIE